MGLAGSSRCRRRERDASRGSRQQPTWKDWVTKFYGKPVKIAVSCAGTTNPYFAPTKAGAEDAGAQLGIDMLWTGVPDGNTVNQIAPVPAAREYRLRGDRRYLLRARCLDRADQEGHGRPAS